MKIRTGFVSNSSTSSFVVVIRKPTTPMEELLIECIDILAKEKCKGNYDEMSIESYKEQLLNEIEEIDKDITCGNERIVKLEKLSKVKNVKEIMQLARETDKTLRSMRYQSESHFKFNLDDEIDYINTHFKNADSKKQMIQDRISALTTLDNADRVLIFDKDQWDSDKVKRALKLFDEVGKILKVIDADTD